MTARAALVIAVILLAGCGGDDPPALTPPTIGSDEKSVDAVENHLAELVRRKDAAEEAGDQDEAERLEQEIQKIERRQDAAIEEEFGTDTPFETALDELPLHEPPLFVEQLVLDDTHELVVRVKPRRFFCGRSPKQRLAAVRSFYEVADERMQAEGVEDFSLIVDGLRETGVVKPLARGAGGRVSLTARGRGAGPC